MESKKTSMKEKTMSWTFTIPKTMYEKIRKEQLNKSTSADQIVIEALDLYFAQKK